MRQSLSQKIIFTRTQCSSNKDNHPVFPRNNSLQNVNRGIQPKEKICNSQQRITNPKVKIKLNEEQRRDNDEDLNNSEINFPKARGSNCLRSKVSIFAHNSYQGTIRNYNEDRIAIEIDVQKTFDKKTIEDWPRIDYFAIFDGHAGIKSSEYLKQHFLDLILNEDSFPQDPIKALKNAFIKAESHLLKEESNKTNYDTIDNSGSCAIVLLIIKDICYCANLGDSRGIYSENQSHKVNQISIEHRPHLEDEKSRIHIAGGSLFRLHSFTDINNPWRISPGNLAVSRALGDIRAKFFRFGGNPNVLIATPEIISFKLSDKSDFILLGSDGIFDALSNRDIVKQVWKVKRVKDQIDHYSKRQMHADVVDSILSEAMSNGSSDNVSCIFISFRNFLLKKEGFLTPLKYINQINCTQVLQQKALIASGEEGKERMVIKHSPYVKHKDSLNYNSLTRSTNSSNKYCFGINEDTIVFNSCNLIKFSSSNQMHSQTIFPVIKGIIGIK